MQELLAAGGYKMLFIHNGKHEVPLPVLEKYEQSNGEKFSFSYYLGSYPSIRFDPLHFLGNFEFLYLVDDTAIGDSYDFFPQYYSLPFYEESISELEAEYQSEELAWPEVLAQLPDSFYNWLHHTVPDLENETYGLELFSLFQFYIASFIQDSTLSWYEVPVLCQRDTFNSFLDTVESEGLDAALSQYKHDIHTVSILSREPISDETVLAVVESHLSAFADVYKGTDVTYFDKYPIPPVKKSIQLLRLPDSDDYLRILTDVRVPSSKVYLKGIHVQNESITLPYAIADIELKQLSVNVCSGDYDTDVARSSLDGPSRTKLAGKAARLVYSDILHNLGLDKTEEALIRQFLDTYYC